MRSWMLVPVVLLLPVAAGCASASKPAVPPTWEGGTLASDVKVVPVARLLEKGSAYEGKKVQVEGIVRKVCQGRGCWVEIEEGEAAMIAKSLDHKVLFPKDCPGKRVLVQGTLRVNPPQACTGGHGEGEKDHECPKPEVLVEIAAAQVF